MANSFINAEKVTQTSLRLLEREIVLPRLVWREAKLQENIRQSKGDTVTVRLPAYVNAQTRALRSGAPRAKGELHERAVAVKLTADVYSDIPITDEQLSLDIKNFGQEVLAPVNASIGRGVEDHLAATVVGANYHTEIEVSEDDALKGIAQARKVLNQANIPAGGRTLLVGADWDMALVTCDKLVRYDQSNTTSTLRDAAIGRLYGFQVVVSNLLPPGTAIAFHSTAFAFVTMAPLVPAGAPWGAFGSYGGIAMRNVRVFDPDEVEDRFIADAWVGSKAVTDQGEFNSNGQFEPADVPEDDGSDGLFVRAVKLSIAPAEEPEPDGDDG